MITWIKKQLVGRYLKGLLGGLLDKIDGKKRYVALLLFVLLQASRVMEGSTNLDTIQSVIDALIQVISASVATPTEADFGVYGFILVALFDALKKWAVSDRYIVLKRGDRF